MKRIPELESSYVQGAMRPDLQERLRSVERRLVDAMEGKVKALGLDLQGENIVRDHVRSRLGYPFQLHEPNPT